MTESTFGPYRVLSELDSGVATTVSRGRHRSLPREVAIKRLRDVVPLSSAFAKALEREATMLAELSHPHIVALYDFVKTEDALGLVLEHIEGVRLDTLREEVGGHLAPDEVVAIAAALADALAHVHARGVVHRDVKPGNVMVGKHGELKLMDFGAAAYVGESETTPSASEGELAFGTPLYLAPEQLLGAEADPKSDVFSLGVLLYELASGEKPLAGSRGRSAVVPLAQKVSTLEPSFAQLVDRCLSRQPADRPTAEELAVGLRELSPSTATPRIVRALLARGRTRLVEGATPPPKTTLKKVNAGRLSRLSRRELTIAAAVAMAGAMGAVVWAISSRREAKTVATPIEVGELRVVATPWAEVSVDGKLIDTTPFARAIPLASGSHRVAFRHPDAPVETREVQIRAGAPVFLDVTMNIRELTAGGGDGGAGVAAADAGGGEARR